MLYYCPDGSNHCLSLPTAPPRQLHLTGSPSVRLRRAIAVPCPPWATPFLLSTDSVWNRIRTGYRSPMPTLSNCSTFPVSNRRTPKSSVPCPPLAYWELNAIATTHNPHHKRVLSQFIAKNARRPISERFSFRYPYTWNKFHQASRLL